MIGRWVRGQPISSQPGFLPYIYVRNVAETLREAVAHGGSVVQAQYPEGNLTVATLRDPAGNVIGIWQEA